MAFIYGFKPNLLFDVFIKSTDEANIFKAVMGIYLSFALLWIVGVYNNQYWKVATISNFCFMFGLAIGRIISILIDGFPCDLFIVGTLGELAIGFFALYEFKKHKTLK